MLAKTCLPVLPLFTRPPTLSITPEYPFFFPKPTAENSTFSFKKLPSPSTILEYWLSDNENKTSSAPGSSIVPSLSLSDIKRPLTAFTSSSIPENGAKNFVSANCLFAKPYATFLLSTRT